jgi:hypothetical protein
MSEIDNQEDTAKKTTLVAKIDQRVLPALDSIASSNQVNTSSLMRDFLGDVADVTDFLVAAKGGSAENMEDKFARLIINRCPGATSEGLRMVQRIWGRAAEIKSQEGG